MSLSIEPYGSNQTLVTGKGCTVLYSYQTPVALVRSDGHAFRTGTKHSVTTSKHINKFLSENTSFAPTDPVVEPKNIWMIGKRSSRHKENDNGERHTTRHKTVL